MKEQWYYYYYCVCACVLLLEPLSNLIFFVFIKNRTPRIDMSFELVFHLFCEKDLYLWCCSVDLVVDFLVCTGKQITN